MSHLKQYLRSLVFVGLIGGLIAACSSTPGPSTSGATASPAPAQAPQSTTAASDIEQAQASLISYFSALHAKRYDEAARLYGGSYIVLSGYNPRVPANDHVKLLENACTVNGFQCLEIKEIVQAETVSPTEFKFTVEFKKQDGSVFTLNTNQSGQQPMTQWPYTVKKMDDVFLVQELPVYTP